jgi:hypothetical protein
LWNTQVCAAATVLVAARMIIIAQLSRYAADRETQAGWLAAFALALCFAWVLYQWFLRGPPQPDPWDDQVAVEMNAESAVPLCHRCLEPHDLLVNFCPQCGAPVGQYTNLLPYPYLFSLGHTLRLGASGEFKRSPGNLVALMLMGLVEYSFLAPFYWFRLLNPFPPSTEPNPPNETPPPIPPGPTPTFPAE